MMSSNHKEIWMKDVYRHWIKLYSFVSAGKSYDKKVAENMEADKELKSLFDTSFITPVTYLYRLTFNESDLLPEDYDAVLDMIEEDDYIPISILRLLFCVSHEPVEDDSTNDVQLICEILTDWMSNVTLVWIIPAGGKEFVKACKLYNEFPGYEAPIKLFDVCEQNEELSTQLLIEKNPLLFTAEERYAFGVCVSRGIFKVDDCMSYSIP